VSCLSDMQAQSAAEGESARFGGTWQVIDEEICFKASVHSNIYELYHCRAQMHSNVYNHRCVMFPPHHHVNDVVFSHGKLGMAGTQHPVVPKPGIY
jgi:hypothetical protein